jgi:YD repeat-containing protein
MKFKIALPTAIIGSLLFSCDPDQVGPSQPGLNTTLAKEIHYNFETSAEIGENVFTYNDRGLVEMEAFTAVGNSDSQEIRSEYDSQGNLIRTTSHWAVLGSELPHYTSTEYKYENGQKKEEMHLFDGAPGGDKLTYFYKGAVLDSSRWDHYSILEEKWRHIRTTFYRYDDQSRLVSEQNHNGRTISRYRYAGDKLRERCEVYPINDVDEFELCTRYEYNNAGQVVSVTQVSSMGSELKEQYFYKEGRLMEKKIFSYPAYEPGNTIDVRLIRYEYQ